MIKISSYAPLEYIGEDHNVVFLHDTMPARQSSRIDFDFESGKIYQNPDYNTVRDTIKENQITPTIVIADHYLSWPNFGYPGIYTADFFIKMCKSFIESESAKFEFSDQYSFTCVLNTERELRLLCSFWLFNNSNIAKKGFYTQSFKADKLTAIQLKELTRNTPFENLQREILPPNWIEYKNSPARKYLKNVKGGNAEIFFSVLGKYFSASTFSIITEPTFWEKGCGMTEKYLMSIYGKCIPIFASSYRLPDALKRLGFDIFDDVVDHSYQWELHPGLRTLQSLELNKDILLDNRIKKQDYIKRLNNNIEIVRDYKNLAKEILLKFNNKKLLAEHSDLLNNLRSKGYLEKIT